ncbi:OsmC family protein [Rhizobium sp. S163]|uniref:OsmC family protein n=1 Tax=Rhizobium sp. S163 TaxID=3055039 RepID=UPI0025A9F2E6|nr:OsmC family protein [Rhizobium sp. S163]MDM9647370.1 OsmC family protein [Rhizobium sp. S163]
MADLKVRTRPVGASAVLGRTGFPHVTSATGGEIDIVTSPSQPGFNPLDLLYSSLSACLVLSARMAASQLGVLDRITELKADVTGEKATEGVSRVKTFNIVFSIKGDIDEETRQKIAHAAEDEICTVSNTIRGNPEFSTVISG